MDKKNNCGLVVYKVYRATFESLVDDRTEDVVPKLHEKGILSDEEKKAGLSKMNKKTKNEVMQAIKKTMREKVEADEDNFRKILAVFSSLSGVDMKYIAQKFEAKIQKAQGPSTQRRSSLDSQMQVRDAAAKKKQAIIAAGTLPKSSSRRKTNTFPHSAQQRSDTRVKFGAVLETIQGSPRVGNKALKEPELDSTEYVNPVQPDKPEPQQAHLSTEHIQQATMVTQETNVTQTHYPHLDDRQSVSITDEELRDELQCINDLEEVVRETIAKTVAQSMENTTSIIQNNMSAVLGRYKNLSIHYQQECEQLKQDVKQLEQKSKQQEKLLKQKSETETQERQDAAALMSSLQQKETEVKNLTAQLEQAKAAVASIADQLRIVKSAEKKGAEGKKQTVEDIREMLNKVQRPGEQDKPVEILQEVQQKLIKLRRPATTGHISSRSTKKDEELLSAQPSCVF